MFAGATSFNQPLETWNTSCVRNMSEMFMNTISFNQPLNSWDTSKVQNMRCMFQRAASFNQPLNSWDTSSVTDMGRMFLHATSFNQPLNSWNTSQVTDMGWMFRGASSFNQPLDSLDTSNECTGGGDVPNWFWVPDITIIWFWRWHIVQSTFNIGQLRFGSDSCKYVLLSCLLHWYWWDIIFMNHEYYHHCLTWYHNFILFHCLLEFLRSIITVTISVLVLLIILCVLSGCHFAWVTDRQM